MGTIDHAVLAKRFLQQNDKTGDLNQVAHIEDTQT